MGDVSSAISGIGAIAGAFGGGGGGSGGGTVVGGPTPAAATAAGNIMASAAKEAANIAAKSVQDAILSINKNYQQARYDVQPYRQEGVQALNQLNQYLGLDAYNPGAAPTAPKPLSLEDFAKKVKMSDIRGYIDENSTTVSNPNGIGQSFQFAKYTGVGAYNNVPGGKLDAGGPASSTDNALYSRSANIGGGVQDFYGLTFLQDQIRNQLAQEQMDAQMPVYEQAKSEYDRNLAEWQQNLDWYNQYTAEGPKTQEQITAEISAQPGYQAELNQGIDAIAKSSSAKGYLGSGRALKELSSFGQNTLSKYYNNTLDRLQSLVQGGQAAATYTATGEQQKGQITAGLQQGLGDTQANAALAAGNAQAQAMLAANQQYKIIGGNSGGGGMK